MTSTSNIKTTRLTSSGQISPAGSACHVVGWVIIGVTATDNVALKNGGASGSTISQIETVIGRNADQISIGKGINFTLDCYAVLTANHSAVTIYWY